MADEWFLASKGKGYGTFSTLQLQQMVEAGVIDPDDLVWRDGDYESTHASTLANKTSPLPVSKFSPPALPASEESAPSLSQRRWGMQLVLAAVLLVTLGSAGWIAFERDWLFRQEPQPITQTPPTDDKTALNMPVKELNTPALDVAADGIGALPDSLNAPPPVDRQVTDRKPVSNGDKSASNDIPPATPPQPPQSPTIAPSIEVVRAGWSNDRGVLTTQGGGTISIGMNLPDRFEVQFTVTRLHGREGLGIGIARSDITVLAILDHYEGSGLELIDGKRRGDTSTFIKRDVFAEGKPSIVVFRVDGAAVSVTVDGQSLIHWVGNYSRLSASGTHKAWGTPAGKLCITSGDKSGHIIRNIEFRALD